MNRPKCKTCLTCFNRVWVENKRYYHCWVCDTYYGGQDKELVLVENPFIGLNQPKEVLEDEPRT